MRIDMTKTVAAICNFVNAPKIGLQGVDWVCVAKNRVQWSAFVKTMESLYSVKCGEFLKCFGKDITPCNYFFNYLGR
jgi:hypothetical protein